MKKKRCYRCKVADADVIRFSNDTGHVDMHPGCLGATIGEAFAKAHVAAIEETLDQIAPPAADRRDGRRTVK